MSEPAPELSIGDVAARTGLSVHALRYYEREGVLPRAVRRGSNGRRVYTEDDVEWLDMCIHFRASGMPLTAIRRYAGLVRQGTGNEADRLAVLRQHQEHVTAQLAQLNECLDIISYKVKVYEEHLARGTAGQLWSPPFPVCEEPPASPERGDG
ncbi:MAG TPA: MerR family transcriptional regulator [Streptosporangiaceae bacterium]|jgi:DNA-binding transcriptional MerR regulator